MARNGSGVYTIPASSDYPAIGGTVISPTDHNATYADIQTALTNSLASNGETTVTGNLPMSGFKLTGLGAGTTNGDSVRYEQVQLIDATLTALAALSTSADTYIKATGTDTFSMASVTSAAQSLLADSSVPRLGVSSTWTAQQFFTVNSRTTGVNPGYVLNQTGGGVDGKFWLFQVEGAVWRSYLWNDANSSAVSWMDVTRSGMAVVNITFGGDVIIPSAAPTSSLSVGYRRTPAASVTTGAITAADSGKCVFATGGVTIPNSTFSQGDVVLIQNVSGSTQTITASVGTLYLTSTGATGNRTLAARGRCAIIFNSGTEAYISGDVT